MTTPPTLLGISGSLRRGSYNTALLRALAELAPSSVTFEQATLHGIPLYDGDVEAESGIPPAVAALKEKIARATGVILVTPEYNSSIPGVFKNAIDWLSRPGSDVPRVFGGRPVALVGASPGRLGTVLSQTAWLPVLRALGTRIWDGPRTLVSSAGQVFDESGKLTDDRARKQLSDFIDDFSKFALGEK